MSRNSSGTYSLPAGNPVVTGTNISSTVHNATMADFRTEITDSLSRSAKGAMLAALQGYAGTVSLPGYTFDGDLDTGLYRIGANNPGMSAGGTKIQEWATTGTTVALTLSTLQGITATQSVANTPAITGTGNGTAAGLKGTGGATAGPGLEGVGGAGGPGVKATKGSATDIAITSDGHIKLTASNPASTAPFINELTPPLIPKAWALIRHTGVGAVSVFGGQGIASVALNGSNNIEVTLAQAMADTNYCAVPTPSFNGNCAVTITSATVFVISGISTPNGGANATVNFSSAGGFVHVVVFGKQ